MDSIDSELKQNTDILDTFEQIYGVKNINIPPAIDAVFGLTFDQTEKLTPEQCAYNAYILSEYSYYLQKLQNKEIAKERWVNNKILNLVSPKLSSYDQYTKYEVKLRLIAQENQVVNKLLKLVENIQQNIDRLNFISSHVKHLSDAMTNIQRAKSYAKN